MVGSRTSSIIVSNLFMTFPSLSGFSNLRAKLVLFLLSAKQKERKVGKTNFRGSASIWVVITEVPLSHPQSATFAPPKCHFRTLKVPLSHPQSATSYCELPYFVLQSMLFQPPNHAIPASKPCDSSLQTMRFQPSNHAFPASKLPFHAQPLHSQPLHSTVGYGKGVGGLSN